MSDGTFQNLSVTENLSVTGRARIGVAGDPNAELHISAPNVEGKIFLEQPGGKILKLAVDTEGTSIGTIGDYPLNLQTNSSTRLYITNSGNVGIGTTVPNRQLEVNGIVKATKFQGDGSELTGIKFPPSTNQWAGDSSSISYGGNVGIGTTTPTQKFEVNGTVKATKFQGDGSELTGIKFPPSTNQWVSGSSGIISYSGGNVGIGTIEPQGKLDVRGDIRAGNSDIYFTKTDHNHTGIGNTEGFAAIENASNFDALMILGRVGTKGRTVKLWDYLQVNGGMDITGDVGIGTDTPSAKLHIYEPTNAAGEGGSIKFFDKGSEYKFEVSYDGGSDGQFTFTNTGIPSGETRFQASATGLNLLTIKNNGEVIGNLFNSSSRELKENITDFSTQEAIEALANLNPVKFNYREDNQKQLKAGFIAEDVPELVATADRKGICALDIVAVLTKVIQQQQEELSSLKERLNALEASV